MGKELRFAHVSGLQQDSENQTLLLVDPPRLLTAGRHSRPHKLPTRIHLKVTINFNSKTNQLRAQNPPIS